MAWHPGLSLIGGKQIAICILNCPGNVVSINKIVRKALVYRKTFCPNEDDFRKVLSFIPDISSVRYNIRLTLMGQWATLL